MYHECPSAKTRTHIYASPLVARQHKYLDIALLLQALSGPYHLPFIHSSGFTITCFLAAELLALLHEDKGI